uniref:Uncharacterized protein n=1 Tax=Timema poppense TaxID=170557 RepID=A0A7R9GUK6_TIMPO|nr:unnamed protein product [Timema poppensis]
MDYYINDMDVDPVAQEDIVMLIGKLKRNKEPGPDGIMVEEEETRDPEMSRNVPNKITDQGISPNEGDASRAAKEKEKGVLLRLSGLYSATSTNTLSFALGVFPLDLKAGVKTFATHQGLVHYIMGYGSYNALLFGGGLTEKTLLLQRSCSTRAWGIGVSYNARTEDTITAYASGFPEGACRGLRRVQGSVHGLDLALIFRLASCASTVETWGEMGGAIPFFIMVLACLVTNDMKLMCLLVHQLV